MHPAHKREPLLVAAPHPRTERLFRNHIGQQHVLVGVFEFETVGDKLRAVCGVDVATFGFIALAGFVGIGERDDLQRDLVGAGEVGEVQLVGRALANANGRAIQFFAGLDAGRLAHHESLSVIVIDGSEDHTLASIPAGCPGCRARQHVDGARLQRDQPVLRRQRHVTRTVWIVENDRRQRAAEIRVETGPHAFIVGRGEARHTLAGAAGDVTARLDGFERGLGRYGAKGRDQG